MSELNLGKFKVKEAKMEKTKGLHLVLYGSGKKITVSAACIQAALQWPKINNDRMSIINRAIKGQTVNIIDETVLHDDCSNRLTQLILNHKKKKTSKPGRRRKPR